MRVRRISGAMPPAPVHSVELYGPEKAPGTVPIPPPPPEPPPPDRADWTGDAQQRRVERDFQNTARQAELQQGTNQEPIQLVLAASRRAGLNPSEILRLKTYLTSLESQLLTDEIDFLRGSVLRSAHPARVLRAYLELSSLMEKSEGRIEQSTFHSIISCMLEIKGEKKVKGTSFTTKQAGDAMRSLMGMTATDHRIALGLLSTIEENEPRTIVLRELGVRRNSLLNPAINDIFRNMTGMASYFLAEVQTLAAEMQVHTGELMANKMEGLNEVSPATYLKEGFLTEENQIRPGIYGFCSAAMAHRCHSEGVPAATVRDMVDVLSRIGEEIREISGEDADFPLDASFVDELRALQDLAEFQQAASLKELLEASEPWLQSVRDLAALAVHLERILSHLTSLQRPPAP